MSTYSDIIDSVTEDLQANVPSLSDGMVLVHRYAPQNISILTADGASHLAVYPAVEAPESARPITTDAMNVTEEFRILYWEDAGGEMARGVTDEAAASEMLEILDQVRTRFLQTMNVAQGDAWRLDWVGAFIGAGGAQDSGFVRYFEARFRAQLAIPWE